MKKRISIGMLLLLSGLAAWKFIPVKQQPLHPQAVGQTPESRKLRVADTQVALNERLRAAREISTDLTNDELKQLLIFLRKPIDPRTGEDDFLAINEVMNKLRVSGMACGEYANALCGLIRDPETHPVVRDYAIQHAASWIKDAGTGNFPARISTEDQGKLFDCMVAFLQEPMSVQQTGFGTTLNMLQSLQETCPNEVQEIFDQSTPRIIGIVEGRESCPMANRVTAIQSLPHLQDQEQTRTILRNILAEANANSPCKLVAIATLGQVGDASDLATFKKMKSDDSRFSYAARAATARLESSLSSSSR